MLSDIDLITWILYNSATLKAIDLSHLTRHGCTGTVVLFQPKYRLAHPENYLFSLSKRILSESKYPRKILFNFEKISTVQGYLRV